MAAARPSILVVDDDPSFRNVLDMRLQQWGYRVRVAQDAREAEDIAREWRPDLVLSDVVMPEASGMDLLGRLRSDDATRPVILLTAHATVEMAVEAMKLGAVDFLTKPCPLEDLEIALAKARRRRLESLEPAIWRAMREPSVGEAQPDTSGAADAHPPLTLEAIERVHILAALERNGGNRAATAAELGISERTLYYRLGQYQRPPSAD